ncbi:hypothetical protein SEA_THUNDERCLAP_17 [Arthrobacter phage Thunderclap]|uniref:Uncharacterized protein n=2 Tax=Amigovirus amigo TaxID=1982100 RepID=A0A0U4B5V7_9CAUD|nr:hypothetical protein RINGS_16 [Arthrobacter phage Rings]QOR56072.1 hypothetical protein SEA_THUNDERCLAP_17 [Arthrobacter phage Thunderclap]
MYPETMTYFNPPFPRIDFHDIQRDDRLLYRHEVEGRVTMIEATAYMVGRTQEDWLTERPMYSMGSKYGEWWLIERPENPRPYRRPWEAEQVESPCVR